MHSVRVSLPSEALLDRRLRALDARVSYVPGPQPLFHGMPILGIRDAQLGEVAVWPRDVASADDRHSIARMTSR